MYKMHVVSSPGEMLKLEAEFMRYVLRLGISAWDSCPPSLLKCSAKAYATPYTAKAIRRKHDKFRGTRHSVFFFLLQPFPLPVTTVRVDVHDASKAQARRRAHDFRETFEEAADEALIAKETRVLRRELSITLRDPISHRTGRYMTVQTVHDPGPKGFLEAHWQS